MPARKTTKETKKQKVERVVVKFGWNNERINVSPDAALTTKSKLMAVITDLQERLPGIIFEGGNGEKEPTLLHTRVCVARRDWSDVTLEEVGVESGGSALLTLNLPGAVSPNFVSKKRATSERVEAATKAPVQTPPTTTTTVADLTVNAPLNANANVAALASKAPAAGAKDPPTIESSLDRLLTSHFDADCRECLKTLMKVLDNVLHKPNDPRTRSIRVRNPAFHKKVASKAGGVDFLLACGFAPDQRTGDDVSLTLRPEHESPDDLYRARRLLYRTAVDSCGMDPKDLPPLRRPAVASSTKRSSAAMSFDPFRPHSFSAAPGKAVPGNYVSSTERQLNELHDRAERIDEAFRKRPLERNWVVHSPQKKVGPVPTMDAGPVSTSGDGALLAHRAKRMDDERRKREEGGFTTKAMRDLEKMKKTKVFSHAQLRVCFPDGFSVSGNFYPNETIEEVRNLLRERVLTPSSPERAFDLYVTPPRRVLPPGSSVREEGLVPAARVFLSWKNGASPSSYHAGAYLREDLLREEPSSKGASSDFPNSKSVATTARPSGPTDGDAALATTATKPRTSEEDLMNRMMGRGSSLLGGKKKTTRKNDDGASSKPKWFPK